MPIGYHEEPCTREDALMAHPSVDGLRQHPARCWGQFSAGIDGLERLS